MNNKMSRRKFLAAVGVGGAAVAAVATQGGKLEEAAAVAGQKVRQGQGYQVTEHVRRYYETTKV